MHKTRGDVGVPKERRAFSVVPFLGFGSEEKWGILCSATSPIWVLREDGAFTVVLFLGFRS